MAYQNNWMDFRQMFQPQQYNPQGYSGAMQNFSGGVSQNPGVTSLVGANPALNYQNLGRNDKNTGGFMSIFKDKPLMEGLGQGAGVLSSLMGMYMAYSAKNAHDKQFKFAKRGYEDNMGNQEKAWANFQEDKWLADADAARVRNKEHPDSKEDWMDRRGPVTNYADKVQKRRGG